MSKPNNCSPAQSYFDQLPETVGSWALTQASKNSDRPTANYEHPSKERVYVNITRPNLTQRPNFWRAKYNNHGGETQVIDRGHDPKSVIESAINWMEANQATGEEGTQAQLTLNSNKATQNTTSDS